jgi:hypothetical protein
MGDRFSMVPWILHHDHFAPVRGLPMARRDCTGHS